MRRNGFLLPISSLPSKYGIGSFSKEAYEFVDILEEAGQYGRYYRLDQQDMGILHTNHFLHLQVIHTL